MAHRTKIVSCIMALLFLICLIPLVHGGTGNAEVSRTRNLQYFEMTPSVHPPGNAFTSRTRNLEYFEMTTPVHPPGDSYASRVRNLQYFEMTPSVHPPGDAYTTRTRNLQYFELGPLAYYFRINITSFQTTEQNGNPTTNFLAGDTIQFELTVKNLNVPESMSLSNALISVSVTDPSGEIAFIGYLFSDLPKGVAKDFTLGYTTSINSPPGTYTAGAMVFTDWPSLGGEGLDIETKTFTVG